MMDVESSVQNTVFGVKKKNRMMDKVRVIAR
jgi:hypothetical protein